MSVHSDTLSRFRSNQSMSLLFNSECLAEKQQIHHRNKDNLSEWDNMFTCGMWPVVLVNYALYKSNIGVLGTKRTQSSSHGNVAYSHNDIAEKITHLMIVD